MSPTLVLLGMYIVILIALQAIGFLISQATGYFNPAISLMTFLILFMGMFAVAWPIAVRVTDWLVPETEHERTQRLART
jgi:hypothetical protein